MPAEDAIPPGAGALGVAVGAPPYDAVLFDMDGVVLDTAALHAAAWRDLFDAVLEDPRLASGAPHRPFDADEDCRHLIDGRARQDGIEAFLASRGIDLPRGDETDPPEALSVHGLAALKQQLFAGALAEHGARAFPGFVALIRRLRACGVPIALVTAAGTPVRCSIRHPWPTRSMSLSTARSPGRTTSRESRSRTSTSRLRGVSAFRRRAQR